MIALKSLQVARNNALICNVPSLSVDAGELVAIVGGNGSGKTTLLRVLAGIERDYQGSCQVLADAGDVVFVHQAPYLFRGTALSNVTYGLRVRGVPRAETRRRGFEWLERCGAEHLANRTAAYLSGGERKRVALARALVIQPKLILLDEPFEEVDAAGIATLSEALSEIVINTTVLVTAPDPPSASLRARIFPIDRS